MESLSDNAPEFMTQHRLRADAKAEEQRRDSDAFSKHYEDFVRPWDGAWDLLASAIHDVYYKPGVAETTDALVDAIRRIAKLSKGTEYEDCIRAATERCLRLYRRDPTGKSFKLADVADRAAILTILQACLDGSGSIEELAAKLRVTSPHVGKSCRNEVEYAGQIVPLQAGTPKETPPATIPVEQPAGGDDVAGDAETEVPAGLDNLTPVVKRAWASWKWAEAKHAETPLDRIAYDWLNEQHGETFIGDLVGYELPAFDTWQRYVREARKAVGESKNQSRAGRAAGSSVVQQSEI